MLRQPQSLTWPPDGTQWQLVQLLLPLVLLPLAKSCLCCSGGCLLDSPHGTLGSFHPPILLSPGFIYTFCSVLNTHTHTPAEPLCLCVSTGTQARWPPIRHSRHHKGTPELGGYPARPRPLASALSGTHSFPISLSQGLGDRRRGECLLLLLLYVSHCETRQQFVWLGILE